LNVCGDALPHTNVNQPPTRSGSNPAVPLSVIAGWLTAMAAVRSPSPGKVAFVDAVGRPPVTSCERIMLDRALVQLTEIAGRDRRPAGAQGRLEQALRSLAEPVGPR
jgi:hypothetical protein